MTREELIKKQAEIYTDNRDNYVEWSDGWAVHNDIKFVEKAFIEGAQWADNNPKSPWISVDDDLPCNHEDMIFEINPLDKSTNCVLVRFSYGGVSIESMHCRGYKQEWCWSADNITH